MSCKSKLTVKMYLFYFDYDTNCFQVTYISIQWYTDTYQVYLWRYRPHPATPSFFDTACFHQHSVLLQSPNNYKMSPPSKVLENYRHLCASKLLPTYQTSPSKSHLNMQTRDISCGWRGVKIKCMQPAKEIGALTCVLAGLSSCDEIWFGESFDITRQWYPKDTGEMASPLIAMFHYNMHITWLPRARF